MSASQTFDSFPLRVVFDHLFPRNPKHPNSKISQGYIPTDEQQRLRKGLDECKKKNVKEELQRADPFVKEFLYTMSVLFSRERSGCSRGPAAASQITATLLERLFLGGEVIYILYVAKNGGCDEGDRKVRDFVEGVVNGTAAVSAHHEIYSHAQGRLRSYLEDARKCLFPRNTKPIRDLLDDMTLTLHVGMPPHLRKALKAAVHVLGELHTETNKMTLTVITRISVSLWKTLRQHSEDIGKLGMQTSGDEDAPKKAVLRLVRALYKLFLVPKIMCCLLEFKKRKVRARFEVALLKKPTLREEADKGGYVHCEVQLMDWWYRGARSGAYDFIGCSKRPCVPCWLTVEGATGFKMMESHYKIYPKWRVTEGMLRMLIFKTAVENCKILLGTLPRRKLAATQTCRGIERAGRDSPVFFEAQDKKEEGKLLPLDSRLRLRQGDSGVYELVPNVATSKPTCVGVACEPTQILMPRPQRPNRLPAL